MINGESLYISWMKLIFRKGIFFFTLLLTSLTLVAQSITINEVSPDNSSFEDEDGKAKDWIELYNHSEAAIDIMGWTISDDSAEPNKWTFPAKQIPPNSFLVIFASGKDRTSTQIYKTLVAVGDDSNYLIPNAATSQNWRELPFDDSDWQSGATGIGYSDGDDQTIVPNGTKAVFLRQYFELDQPHLVEDILFHVDYDDGCAAYLNGIEIARANLPNTPGPAPYDLTPFIDREARLYQGGDLEEYVIENSGTLLKEGTNVLAVQVHNFSSNSSDLSILPYLSVSATQEVNGIPPPIELGLQEAFLHTNFKIKTGETVYLFNAEGQLMDSLAIPILRRNSSFGRFPDGADHLEIFAETTPNNLNKGEGIKGIVEEAVVFSKVAGLYQDQFDLILSGGQEGDIIRYTKDGSDPLPFSNSYINPIPINRNTVIKAAIFRQDFLPSEVTTNTYLLNAEHDLPIVALSFKPRDFFDPSEGIYELGLNAEGDFPHFGANFWEDVEKPIHISFFEENGTLGFSANAGTKIFGGWSRGLAQRSLSIFFRNQYGTNNLDYPLFDNRPYDQYEAFILRNSGNDWQNTMLRDLTLTGLMENSNVDIQAGRPAVAYLNGEYWGIYNIREKINEHYLAALHNVPAEDITILEKNGEVIFGDNAEYQAMIDISRFRDLGNETNYQAVASQIDLENYIQYQIAQIYMDNTDWPGNNIKFWKAKNGKWRWILFDTDFGFGIWSNRNYNNNTLAFALEQNGPGWPNPPWSTLLFRRLMLNDGFKKRFINTFADELNTRFQAEVVRVRIDENVDRIRSEMTRQINRWSETSMQAWQNQIDVMKSFANQRLFQMRKHIQEEFDLPQQRTVRVRIEDASSGSVQLNTIMLRDNDWQGIYFQSVPISLTALAKTGYLFDRWSGDVTGTTTTVTIDPTNHLNITAHFKRSDNTALETDIIINEINYNSNEEQDAGDWVELYNRGPVEQNISDWIFKDGNDDHNFTLPQGTVLPANGYLVLTNNSIKFQEQFPTVQNQIGDFDFKLSSEGELIRLFNADNLLIDSLTYLPDGEWPKAANGMGPTLELVNPEMDNATVDNWTTFPFTGTPGALNGVYTTTTHFLPASSISVFPNPVTNDLRINVSLPSNDPITISLVSITGQEIYAQSDLDLAGESFSIDLSTIATGTYWIKIATKEGVVVTKVIKI